LSPGCLPADPFQVSLYSTIFQGLFVHSLKLDLSPQNDAFRLVSPRARLCLEYRFLSLIFPLFDVTEQGLSSNPLKINWFPTPKGLTLFK